MSNALQTRPSTTARNALGAKMGKFSTSTPSTASLASRIRNTTVSTCADASKSQPSTLRPIPRLRPISSTTDTTTTDGCTFTTEIWCAILMWWIAPKSRPSGITTPASPALRIDLISTWHTKSANTASSSPVTMHPRSNVWMSREISYPRALSSKPCRNTSCQERRSKQWTRCWRLSDMIDVVRRVIMY